MQPSLSGSGPAHMQSSLLATQCGWRLWGGQVITGGGHRGLPGMEMFCVQLRAMAWGLDSRDGAVH